MGTKKFGSVAEEAARVVEADEGILDAVEGASEQANLPMLPTNAVFGAVTGDVKATEVKTTRFQLAYGVGGLAEKFANGDMVLDKEHLIAKKGENLTVILLSANKYYKEYTEYTAGGDMPRVWASEADAQAAGMVTNWGPRGSDIRPTAGGAMTIRMLIEKPANLVCGLFGLDIGGVMYAPVVWDVDKTAYKAAAGPIFQAASVALKARGLASGKWSLTTRMEKNKKGNIYPVPVFAQNLGYVSDEFLTELKQKLGVK